MKSDFPVTTTLAVFALGVAAVALVPCLAATAAAATPLASRSSFYCDHAALSPERRIRHFDVLGPALVAKRVSIRELPDGYRFQLPSDPETYQQAAEWIDGERMCCPFFDIALRISRDGGPLWLSVTGRPGTKEFIRAE